jgi:hypothetical protein
MVFDTGSHETVHEAIELLKDWPQSMLFGLLQLAFDRQSLREILPAACPFTNSLMKVDDHTRRPPAPIAALDASSHASLMARRPSPTHRPSRLTSRFPARIKREKLQEKRTHSPKPSLHEPHNGTLNINNTLAGVAQLVERVALITAKRSTSRSWVRAPPSAIPIS